MSKQRKLKKGWHIFYQCALDTRDAHIAAYSARSAFFLIVSLIPCIILVLRFLAFTPFSGAADRWGQRDFSGFDFSAYRTVHPGSFRFFRDDGSAYNLGCGLVGRERCYGNFGRPELCT